MMKLWRNIILIFTLLIIFNFESNSQTCGFGCFGLGGFYAGYGIQNYNAGGLNNYFVQLRMNNPKISRPVSEFKSASGFRIGANFFRTKYSGFLFTAKGFYQFSKEENHTFQNIEDNSVKRNFVLDLNYWGLGFDIGHSFIPFVDWKIIDASMNFHSADFYDQIETVQFQEKQYSNSKLSLGFSIGTGFVIRLLQHYISIESTAGYSRFSFSNFYDENNVPLIENSNDKNLIEGGGFFGIIQLNVGIPLY